MTPPPDDVVRDRHTGDPLTCPPAGSPVPRAALRGQYLGARHPLDLHAADLRGADLRGADVTGKDLSDADLTGALLDGLRFDRFTRFPAGVDPRRLGAVEAPPDLAGQTCDGRDFAGADLARANLAGASAVDADFTGADLSGAILRAVRAAGASFRDARLVGANLTKADLTGADLTGADLADAVWNGATRWPEGFVPPAAPAPTPGRDALAARFKALGDPMRLTILGLLLRDEHSGEELADTLSLSEPTISHHVARLREAGLIETRAEGVRRLYRAEASAIDGVGAGLAARLTDLVTRHVDPDAYDRKVIDAFFDGPRLRSIPARQKKQRVVLKRLLADFTPGEPYPESAVNDILRRAHDDVATLRRLMIAERLMARENGVYRRL